ncbi:MAG: hypothetical protein HXY28_13220 [Hydrogenophilaceae bacterium]|jgi:hypothetical protein|nr:hypothetical protein [Hydrogenophilaceae bacterium]
MRALRRVLALALTLLLVAGCALSQRDEALSRAPMEALRARDMTALYDMLSPGLRNQETRAALETMMAMVPAAPPDRIRTASWRVTTTSGARTVETLSLYEYRDRMLEVRARMVTAQGANNAELESFSVTPIDSAAVAANALRFDRMTSVHLAMLAGAVASLALMIAGFVAVLRTRGFAMKWLFAILAFAGVGAAWLNWTTGEAGFHLAAVNLIGFGFSRAASPLSPWILHFSAPVGAILVLALTQRHRARRDAA